MLNAVSMTRLATDSHAIPPRPPAQAPDAASIGFDPVTTHFQREASRLLNASDLLDDRLSLALMQQALGFRIDPHASRQHQAELISSMINFHDFQIPSKIQQFIQLYNLSSATPEPAGPEPPHEPLLPPQPAPAVSDGVLESLQTLRIGGV